MNPSSSFIQETIEAIQPLSQPDVRRAQVLWDGLTKPQGSLGRLESLGTHYVAMTKCVPSACPDAMVFTLAGDHGVTTEGVSAYPSSVTAQMVLNFLHGGAAINVLARQIGAKVRVVDMGVREDLGAPAGLWVRKIGRGTRNFCLGSAMSREQAIQSVEEGIRLVGEAHHDGIGVIGIGDMGIGNTTASSAITAVMTDQPVPTVTGRGTGLDEAGLTKKNQVITRGLQVNQPQAADPLDVLSKVGGFEIGGLVGLILGGAARRLPVVLDGFITGAALLLAYALAPRCLDYVIPSHQSVEQGHRVVMDTLGLRPLLDLDLRLGEGTGACLAIGLLQSSLACLTQMATFSSAGVDGALHESPDQV